MNNFKWASIAVLGFVMGAIVTYALYPILSSNGTEMEKTTKKPLYWVAPMDASYRRDQPGKSPMGMDLLPVYQEEGGEEASDGASNGVVSISPAVMNNLGVKLGKVTQNTMPLKVNTVGFIGFNEETLSHFHSRLEGWIEELSVNAVGDPVKKGQKLFELYSPELVNAQEEFIVAVQSNNKHLENASMRKLASLGIEPAQIQQLKRLQQVQQRLAFYAKQDGYVSALNVREGSYINPANNVVSVGSLDSVWVNAEIFERQAGWIETGQKVVMHTDAYSSDMWEGEVNYIYPVLDAQTRTLRTRIVFANPDHRLKPNMFTRLSIEAKARENVLSIPREAVIRNAGITRVVKSLGEGKFKSVRIETGMESNGRIEVISGLQLGDDVVVSSQFLIDSESNTSAELSRIDEPQHTHTH